MAAAAVAFSLAICIIEYDIALLNDNKLTNISNIKIDNAEVILKLRTTARIIKY